MGCVITCKTYFKMHSRNFRKLEWLWSWMLLYRALPVRVLCRWMFVLRCLGVSLLAHTIHQTETPAVVYIWLQTHTHTHTHLLFTKCAWSTRIAPAVSLSYKSVAVVTAVAVCLLRSFTSANVQTFSDLRRFALRLCLPGDGVWLYAS